MARALDDFVVGSQQHLDEVAAFVREIEAISPLARPASLDGAKQINRESATPEPEEELTVKDRTLSRRMWRFRPVGPRLAAAIGVSLAALGVGTAVGLRITTAAASEPAPAAIRATVNR